MTGPSHGRRAGIATAPGYGPSVHALRGVRAAGLEDGAGVDRRGDGEVGQGGRDRHPRRAARVTTRSGSTTTSTTSPARPTRRCSSAGRPIAAISQRDDDDPPRPDGRLRQLPQPGAARQDHGDGRRHLGRSPRLGHRRRLVRARVPEPTATTSRARPSASAALADTVEIVKRMWTEPDATYRGRYLLDRRSPVRPEAAAAASPADLDRRGRRAADPARRCRARRLLELRRRSGDVDAQARRAAIALRSGRRDASEIAHDVVAGDPPPRHRGGGRRRGDRSLWGGDDRGSWRASNLVGTPEQVCEKLAHLRRLPVSPAWSRGAPTIPTPRRSSCFARDVVPNFR